MLVVTKKYTEEKYPPLHHSQRSAQIVDERPLGDLKNVVLAPLKAITPQTPISEKKPVRNAEKYLLRSGLITSIALRNAERLPPMIVVMCIAAFAEKQLVAKNPHSKKTKAVNGIALMSATMEGQAIILNLTVHAAERSLPSDHTGSRLEKL